MPTRRPTTIAPSCLHSSTLCGRIGGRILETQHRGSASHSLPQHCKRKYRNLLPCSCKISRFKVPCRRPSFHKSLQSSAKTCVPWYLASRASPLYSRFPRRPPLICAGRPSLNPLPTAVYRSGHSCTTVRPQASRLNERAASAAEAPLSGEKSEEGGHQQNEKKVGMRLAA